MSACVYLLCREVCWPAKTVSAVLLRLGGHITEQEKGSPFRGHGAQVFSIHVRQHHAWPDCTTLLCRTINIYIIYIYIYIIYIYTHIIYIYITLHVYIYIIMYIMYVHNTHIGIGKS